MTPRRWLFVVLAAAAVLLLAGRALAHAYVEYAWFASFGAASVWRERTAAVLTLRVVSGIASTLFVFANLYTVRRSVISLVLPRRIANLEISEELSSVYLTAGVFILAIVLGALLSLPQDDWSSWLLARHGAPFGEVDPYFGNDLGFYVYWLPFEESLQMWTLISVLIVAAMVVFLYALTPNLRWDRGTIYVSSHVRRHLVVLCGVLLLMLAWSYRLAMYRLLVRGSGPEGAFGYVDHTVAIPGALVLSLVSLGGALVVAWTGWTGQLRVAAGAIVTVLVLAFLVRTVAPWLAARPESSAESQVREEPYQSARASYTRRAYDVETIVRAPAAFSYASLPAASRWVSSWDEAALLALAGGNRRDEPRAIGWRATPAGLVAELPMPPDDDASSHPWRIVRMAPANADPHVAVSARPDSANDELVAAPRVFEGASGTLVVDDTTQQVVGPTLTSATSRIAFAWSFQRPGLLFSEVPRGATVLLHRDVRDRLRTLMPFFAQSTAATPIVQADTIFWVVDLYAASSWYPLARTLELAGDSRTYFRHAATAIVNGTSGRVTTVPDSQPDPITTTWLHRYPDLFSTWRAVSPAVRQALPPAMDELSAQAAAFGRYGTRVDHDVPRVRPALTGADSAAVGNDPPFALADGATAAGFPLVTRDGEELRGMVIATGGAVRQTFWLPAAQQGRRWTPLVDRLRGGEPVKRDGFQRGSARAVPIAGSVALVQSTYAWRPPGAPALARVAALVGDSLATAPSMVLFSSTPVTAPTPPTPASFGALVEQLYRSMRDALRQGDWTRFGAAFDSLGRAIPNRPH